MCLRARVCVRVRAGRRVCVYGQQMHTCSSRVFAGVAAGASTAVGCPTAEVLAGDTRATRTRDCRPGVVYEGRNLRLRQWNTRQRIVSQTERRKACESGEGILMEGADVVVVQYDVSAGAHVVENSIAQCRDAHCIHPEATALRGAGACAYQDAAVF